MYNWDILHRGYGIAVYLGGMERGRGGKGKREGWGRPPLLSKIVVSYNLPMCDYQCTSQFYQIVESNRIESNYFSPNRNALLDGCYATALDVPAGIFAIIRRRGVPVQNLIVVLVVVDTQNY